MYFRLLTLTTLFPCAAQQVIEQDQPLEAPLNKSSVGEPRMSIQPAEDEDGKMNCFRFSGVELSVAFVISFSSLSQ